MPVKASRAEKPGRVQVLTDDADAAVPHLRLEDREDCGAEAASRGAQGQDELLAVPGAIGGARLKGPAGLVEQRLACRGRVGIRRGRRGVSPTGGTDEGIRDQRLPLFRG